jgi:hypothetical protein
MGEPLKIEQKAAKRTKRNREMLALIYTNRFLVTNFKPAVKPRFSLFLSSFPLFPSVQNEFLEAPNNLRKSV